MVTGALQPIGRLDFAPAALKHMHVKEARAILTVMDDGRPESVIGTTNRGDPRTELYGWGRNVPRHVDNLGFAYFCPLIARRSIVYCEHRLGSWRTKFRPSKWHSRVLLKPGTVYRLFDHYWHWTRDSAPAVCLFAGLFKKPDDNSALAMLRVGLDQLAAGAEDAPRVSEGFRVPLEGECYADTPQGKSLVKVRDAKANGWLIAQCLECDGIAVKVDAHWPYMWDHNRCGKHLETE